MEINAIDPRKEQVEHRQIVLTLSYSPQDQINDRYVPPVLKILIIKPGEDGGISVPEAEDLIEDLLEYHSKESVPVLFTYDLPPTDGSSSKKGHAVLGEILSKQRPDKRPLVLREPANFLNDIVEDYASYFGDDDIYELIQTMQKSYPPSVYKLEQIINKVPMMCYQSIFENAANEIKPIKDTSPLNSIDGSHTHVIAPEDILIENRTLLPDIFIALLTKIQNHKPNCDILEALKLLSTVDVENLTGVITRLRYGPNGSLANPTEIGKRIEISSKSEETGRDEIEVVINETAQSEAIAQMRDANRVNPDFTKAIGEISAFLMSKGFQVLIPERHFSFNYGVRGGCPVSGHNPYKEQIMLLHRIILRLNAVFNEGGRSEQKHTQQAL